VRVNVLFLINFLGQSFAWGEIYIVVCGAGFDLVIDKITVLVWRATYFVKDAETSEIDALACYEILGNVLEKKPEDSFRLFVIADEFV